MTEKPTNKATNDNRAHKGKLREGLNPKTATIDDCNEVLRYISNGDVWLKIDGERYVAMGRTLDGEHTDDAVYFNVFLRFHLANTHYIKMAPVERLATIINLFAKTLDRDRPLPQGVPTRMQGIGIMQNNEGFSL